MTTKLILNCIHCNKEVQEAMFNTAALPDLLTMISGFVILSLLVLVLAYFALKQYSQNVAINPEKEMLNPYPLSITFIILGIGIGGFMDGIIFHQILQWHGMFTNKLPADTLIGKSVNMFWDGIFHLLTLTTVLIGLYSLTKLLNRKDIDTSYQLVIGGFFCGWGLFNFSEGIIHHQILQFHNVNEFSASPNMWNFGFLASAIIFMTFGFTILYNRRRFTKILESL